MRRSFHPGLFAAAVLSGMLIQGAAPLAAQTPEAAQGQSPAPPTAAADPMAAHKAKLKAALSKANAVDTAFAAEWKRDGKAPGEDGMQVFFAGGPMSQAGRVDGSWHERLTALRMGQQGDRLLLANGRMLARDAKREWCLRKGRFADGNELDYLPDVTGLLDLLASMDLQIAHRDVGMHDDRPAEFVSVPLTKAQIAELEWNSLLPPAVLSSMPNFAAIMLFGQPAAERPEATSTTATIDLAIVYDPAMLTVYELRFRSWQSQEQMMQMGGGVMVQVGQAGVVQVQREAEAEDDDEGDEAKPQGPMQYEKGLPVRSRKGMSVMDYVVRLRDHGQTKAPELTDAQKRLLRL
ncbi:MAG: hypothetical protein RL398_3070 [Planctomycetota bacterium]